MNSISILIVESKLNLLENLVNCISNFCHIIYKATNTQEALEIHRKYKPNITLTDIDIALLNDYELIEVIREKDNTSHIIVISAHTHINYLLKAVQVKSLNYLVKPIDTGELKKIIIKSMNEIYKNKYLTLNNDYMWNRQTKILLLKDKEINLTTYETAFLECMIISLNKDVSYEELHNYIYAYDDYSQGSITSIIKRLRKKTVKGLIKSCFKYGYKLESNLF